MTERKQKQDLGRGNKNVGGGLGGPALREWRLCFRVNEVLSHSTSVPALGERQRSIPPLDASFSVFSQAQGFTGHNLEQLLGLEFTVIVGKCNHTTLELHGSQQMFEKLKKKKTRSLESGRFPLYINTSTALDTNVYKMQFKLLCDDRDQHLQTHRDDVDLPITYGNCMQIICIVHCTFFFSICAF